MILATGTPVFAQNRHSFEVYEAKFQAFACALNPYLQPSEALKIGALNWGLARGDWALARRLAAEEAWETRFLLLAYLPITQLAKGVPRSDLLGSHYNLLAMEAWRLGLLKNPKNWFYDDDFAHLKASMVQDPTLGTWLAGRVFCRKARATGLDRASHFWQSGADDYPYWGDTYVDSIRQKEAQFDKILGGAGPQGPAKRRKR